MSRHYASHGPRATVGRPPKMYHLSLAQVEALAGVLVALDHQTTGYEAKALISNAHQLLKHTLGSDAGLVYQRDGEVAA